MSNNTSTESGSCASSSSSTNALSKAKLSMIYSQTDGSDEVRNLSLYFDNVCVVCGVCQCSDNLDGKLKHLGSSFFWRWQVLIQGTSDKDQKIKNIMHNL